MDKRDFSWGGATHNEDAEMETKQPTVVTAVEAQKIKIKNYMERILMLVNLI